MLTNQLLNERSLQLLKMLVERYISDGQPVGSRLLSKGTELKLSPATIRNVMADLEELGLVHSPHTSAGRIPTASGYRMFVNSLLTFKQPESNALNRLHQELAEKDDPADVIEAASKLLAELTQMAGIVTMPKREAVCLRHIEFLALSHNRILVIFVTDEHEVHNKIIQTDKKYSPAELQQAANYLNATYAGKTMPKVREAVLKELEADQQRMNQGMLDAVRIAQMALDAGKKKEDYVLAGETNLMGFSELADRDYLRKLFEAFSQKQSVLHLLDQCMKTEGVQIFIGEESGYQAFQQCSLVTSPYSVGDEVVGVLGVIGPTRMAYEKIIPFVDITAKLLGAALNPKTMPPSS